MRLSARFQTGVFLAATFVFFSGLGGTHLWDKDETIYTSCAREMYQRNDWVVPTFNNELFPDKPPLMYWLMMSGFEMFGVSEFAARFWSALFGVGTALCTFHIGKLLFCKEVGFWAGLAVATNVIFTVSARAATVDSVLTFCATLGMLALIAAIQGLRNGDAGEATSKRNPLTLSDAHNWKWLILLYATMGLGFLAKGPIGLILPAATVGLFLMVVSAQQRGEHVDVDSSVAAGLWHSLTSLFRVFHPLNIWRVFWSLRPGMGAVVFLLIAAPWYVMVGIETNGDWLHEFFLEQNVGRALRPMQNHGGSLLYYLVAIAVGFFPWSVFLPGAVVQMFRSLRQGDKYANSHWLLACWIGVYLAFWSLVSTKLPHYVLPAYPAVALITAAFIDKRLARTTNFSVFWARYAVVWMLVSGIGMAVALPVAARYFLPGEELLGLVGLVPLTAGIWCLLWFRRQRPQVALGGFAIMSVVLLVAMFTVAAQRVDRHQTAQPLLTSLRNDQHDTRNLIGFRYLRESYVFYAGHPIPVCHELNDLRDQLESTPRPLVVTTAENHDLLEKEFPGQFRQTFRARRFLKEGHVLVLRQTTRNQNENANLAAAQIDMESEMGAQDSPPVNRSHTKRPRKETRLSMFPAKTER